MRLYFFRLFGFGFVALTFAGCTPIYRNHGYIPEADILSDLRVNVDTRATLEEKIGLPVTQSVLGDSRWLYSRSRWKHRTFYAPEEIEREVLLIRFDREGVLKNVEHLGLQDGRVVVLLRQVMDSPISDLTLQQQLFGSFGNLDASDFLDNE